MKLDDDALLEILRRKEDASAAYIHGQLGAEREKSLREYHRLPYGNEEDGWSQIVSSDIQDSVEWILPSLLRLYTSTDKAVSFEPMRAEDVAGAEQATDTCNYVFYKQNDGFLVLYTAFKDMLTIRNCAVMWRKEDVETVSSVPFRQATPEMLAMLMQGAEDAEIQEVNPEPMMVPGADGQPVQMLGPDGAPSMVYTGRIKKTEKKTVIKVEAFSPEDLLVEREWTSPILSECPYVARMMRVTVSDLKMMGFDVLASELRESSENSNNSRLSRIDRSENSYQEDLQTDDDSMAEGWLRLEYVLVDADGDGIAERLCVYRLHDKILKREVVSHVPIATSSPILNPHRWDGMSIADAVSDLQMQHTELLRQTFNNLYLTNNPRTKVLTDANWSPMANIDDLLDSRPGGIIRQRQADAVQEHVTPFAAGASMPMFEYLQTMRENRTGVTRYNQGIDANSLNKTAHGVSQIMSASQQRIELIARICSETLLKPIFAGILKLLTDGGMKALAFRLRDDFVEYDPNEWRDQYDMTINVGLGTGDKTTQGAALTTIYQMQMAGMQFGLTTPQNLYHTQSKLIENAGFKDVQNFIQDPRKVQPSPPKPDPEQMKMQSQMQLEQFKAQVKAQSDDMHRQHDMAQEQARMRMQAQVDTHRQEVEAQQKTLEIEHMAQLEAIKAAQAARTEDSRLALDKYKIDTESQVKLSIAEMAAQQAGTQIDVGPIEQSVKELFDHMASPVEILRGPDGRISGAKRGKVTKHLVRGPDGKSIGLQ